MGIGVFIVDDSAVVRQVLSQELSKFSDIEVQGVAPDPLFALQKMQVRWPDVVILDVEMPRMDGISFLQQVMGIRPTPVIICSSLAGNGTEVSLRALAAGAFAIVEKPKIGLKEFLVDSSENIVSVVRAAAGAHMDRIKPPVARAARVDDSPRPKLTADEMLEAPGKSFNVPMTEKIVAIGCSTGGTQALEFVLTNLKRTSPGIVVVQHMPEQFTKGFAQRLDKLSQITVLEAKDRDRILPGQALIAPGGKHLLVVRSGAQYLVEVRDGPLVSRHRPSVDVLFRSVAKSAGRNSTGIIMTGMGDDGAHGLKEMHDTGALTFAQDEVSCVVFGMPKEAIRLGGVDHVVGLDQIPAVIENTYKR